MRPLQLNGWYRLCGTKTGWLLEATSKMVQCAESYGTLGGITPRRAESRRRFNLQAVVRFVFSLASAGGLPRTHCVSSCLPVAPRASLVVGDVREPGSAATYPFEVARSGVAC